MKATHRTALVHIPPREIWPPIQAIRRVHDRQFQRWMPHLTLLYPFAPRADLPRHAPALEAACRAIAPFHARLAVFRTFQHRNDRSTIWLAPEPLDAFRALQQGLVEAAPDYDHTSRFAHGFTPHLSVGQSGDPATAEALVAALAQAWRPLEFLVEEVAIIAREPDGPFEVARTIRLGP